MVEREYLRALFLVFSIGDGKQRMDDPIQGIHNNEWLSRILRRTKVKPLVAAILVALFNFVLNVVLAVVFGAWSPSGTRTGFINDPPTWVNQMLLQPATIGYFCWIQYGGQQLFRQLADADILESETHLRKEIEKCGVLFRSPRLARVAAVIGIVLTSAGALGTFVFPRSSLTQSWISVHPLIVLIRFPITFIGNYALAILIFDLVIIVVTLYCLLKERQIRIEPFHPDNAGGMGMIWSFVVNLGYGFAAIGVALSVTTVYFSVSLSDLSGMMPWVIAYVVVASIVFVLPLYSAHRAMKDSRDRLIRKISMEFDSTFAQLNALQWANADEIETYLRKTRQLVETRDLVTRFPVWPVKLDSLGKFLGLILVPLLPTVFSTIIGIFSE